MDEDERAATPPRWPLWLAGAVTLLWVVLAIGLLVVVVGRSGAFGRTLAEVPPAVQLAMAAIITLMPPLATLWLVADRLRDTRGVRAAYAAELAATGARAEEALAAARQALAALDAGLGAAAGRVAQISDRLGQYRGELEATGGSLHEAATRLIGASEAATGAGRALIDTAPKAIAHAETLQGLLTHTDTDLKRQIAETETLLASLQVRAREADAQARETAGRATADLEAIRSAGEKAARDTAASLADLRSAAELAHGQSRDAIAAANDSVGAQTRMLMESVTHVRGELDDIGGEAARQISRRLEMLTGAAGQLGDQLLAQEERSRAMIEQVERAFMILDAKLANSVATGSAALDDITARMAAARDAIHVMGDPIAATTHQLGQLETKVHDIGVSADRAVSVLGQSLPSHLPHLASIQENLEALHARAASLSEPVMAGGEAIELITHRFAEQRHAMDAAAQRLAEALELAGNRLGEIERTAGTTSLAAAQQLIDVLGRVREISDQTAGQMRETLAGVVAEAEQALEHAGTSRAESAFAAPIRAELAQIEAASERATAAAQAASERVAQRLIALTQTVATVESRVDEVDTAYEVKLREDLSWRSQSIIETLNSTSVDIARMLSLDIDDQSWSAYLKGDKGIFTRKAVRLLDRSQDRAIARHFEHDPPFREQVMRFIDGFEDLIRRVQPARGGEAMAVTILSSDIGKLYVILAQAIGRLR